MAIRQHIEQVNMPDQEPIDRPLTIDAFLEIVKRRRWWLGGTAFACWLLIWGVSWLMTPVYRAEAVILIDYPKDSAASNSAADSERLQRVQAEILSPAHLREIVRQFALYPKLQRLGSDYAVEQMRKDTIIDRVTPTSSTFRVVYSASSAQLSQQVTARIASLFIEDTIQEEAKQVDGTTEFLASELQTARESLALQEARLKDFKAKHLGSLPTQLRDNVQVLHDLEIQRSTVSQRLNRAQEQKLYLESLLAQYQTVKMNGENATTTLPALEQELAKLRTALANAQTRYTDQHPDVLQLKGQIARTEKLRRDIESGLATAAKNHQPSRPLSTTAELQTMSPILQLEGQLRANVQEISSAREELRRLDGETAKYQSRVNDTPVSEQQFTDLMRDYEQSKANYDSLLKSHTQSLLAKNLGQRQHQQLFRVLEPPILPRKPYSPERLRYSLGGLVVGIVAGLALMAVIEQVDDRVRFADDLQVDARILVEIPHMTTPQQQQRQAFQRTLEWGAAAVLAVTLIAGNLLTLRWG